MGNWLLNFKKRFLLDILLNGNPEKIARSGDKKIIPAFLNAARNIPLYKKILLNKKVEIQEIKSLEEFKKLIPILTKDDIFNFNISELCVGGEIPKDLVSAFTSSGFSNKFSYGIITKKDNKKTKEIISLLFEYLFNSDKKKTLLINAEAMGVTFSAPYPMITTSVRSDMVLAFLREFKNEFEQFIIFADPHFAKKIIDDGIKQGFDWKSVRSSFIVGGDWISNSLVNYIKSKINGEVGITMGLSELGLNLFHNTAILGKIRNFIQNNRKLRYALFGENTETCPEIMFYYPNRTFIEIAKKDKSGFGELVFSMLDKKLKMPLIRYNSHDIGKLFSFNEFKKILKQHKCSLIPDFKLPIVAIKGRRNRELISNNTKISIEDIKEAIYKNKDIAKKITGYFKLNKGKKILIEFQLRKEEKFDRKLSLKISKEIYDLIGINASIKVYEYSSFPYGMELDYEHKFNCM